MDSELRWQLAAEGRNCGGLVLFPLDIPAVGREPLGALLSSDELARGARFLCPAHGERYVVAHGRLRQLLAAQLGMPAQELRFRPGDHGKPELVAAAAAGSGLRFNLSHSGAWGLAGWSWQHEIGVDVEVWRTLRDEAALVHRFFSAVEVAGWEALPPEQRHEAFFNLWTRKEAYVKGLGHGLGLPLHSFDVSHENGAGARLMRASALTEDRRPWSLTAPVADAGLSLAVVLQSYAISAIRTD